jgi:hypothetical protein
MSLFQALYSCLYPHFALLFIQAKCLKDGMTNKATFTAFEFISCAKNKTLPKKGQSYVKNTISSVARLS